MDAVITGAELIPDAGRMDAERAQARDAPDLGAVFDEHAPALYRTILAYSGGRGDG